MDKTYKELKGIVNRYGHLTSVKEETFESDVYYMLPVNAKCLFRNSICTGVSADFQLPPKITKIIIPDTYEVINQYAFENCFNLKEVVFANESTYSKLKEIGYRAFYNCSSLEKVTFTKTINCVEFGKEAFYNCQALSSINLNNITAKTIPSHCFTNTNICNLYLPESLEGIGKEAFLHANISNIEIPLTLNNIGEGAFKNNNLISIDLKNVKCLGPEAFAYNKLTEITAINLNKIKQKAFAFNEINNFQINYFITKIDSSIFYGNKVPIDDLDKFNLFC